MNLDDNVMEIKGIGEKTAKLFHKLHIDTVADLIFDIPKDFEKYSSPVSVEKLVSGEMAAISVRLHPGSIRTKKGGKYTLSFAVVISEDTYIEVRYFNVPYLKSLLLPGEQYVLRGVPEFTKKNQITMLQPKIYKAAEYQEMIGHLQPCYSLTKGLTNKTLQKAVSMALPQLSLPEDYLTEQDYQKMSIIPLKEALHQIHFPKDQAAFYAAKKRLAFHEFFTFLYDMKNNKDNIAKIPFQNPLLEVAETKRLIEALPYKLTDSQMNAWYDICNDMQQEYAMNRLVQGDVGCGKTILAFLALVMSAKNNRQGCLMAPTEVLAKQHFDGIMELNHQYHLGLHPVLLLGSMSASVRKSIRNEIENGNADIIIGTHAIIQDSVTYHNLALVITDEQHRFGVKQREKLANKGNNPHILVMSATPIPRTLAMILYSDLSISLIKDMPAGRVSIKNCVVGTSYHPKSYQFILQEIEKGHQAYIICPMVESSGDMQELENVIDYSEKLKQIFPNDISISYIHGKMTLAEKNTIMDAFTHHDIDILISTTVIEVGINVPNATIIMIENAQRYGLAQLHQLRGRVGRGKEQSYCIFMSDKENPQDIDRLKVLLNSNDGFEIATQDLKLRGPGQLTGIRQSGELGFHIGDIYEDSDMLLLADNFCKELQSKENQNRNETVKNILMNLHSLYSVDFRTI